MKAFYHELIVFEDVSGALDEFVLDESEKSELLSLAEQILHHHTLNVVLNALPKEKHNAFLEGIEQDPENPKWLEFLKAEIQSDITTAIQAQAKKIKAEILAEIKRSKRS